MRHAVGNVHEYADEAEEGAAEREIRISYFLGQLVMSPSCSY